jgi:hypothetical protein
VEEGVLALCCLMGTNCIKNEETLVEALIAIGKHCIAEKRNKVELKSLL